MVRQIAIVILFAAASVSVQAADHEGSSATMRVSAQVIARAIVAVNAVPEVVVTADDIARGYVDVSDPLVVSLRTNSRNGCLLQVANANPLFDSVELEFGNTRMRVTGESWIQRPYVAGGETVVAQVRVRLASDAVAGRYALPLQVSASPL